MGDSLFSEVYLFIRESVYFKYCIVLYYLTCVYIYIHTRIDLCYLICVSSYWVFTTITLYP